MIPKRTFAAGLYCILDIYRFFFFFLVMSLNRSSRGHLGLVAMSMTVRLMDVGEVQSRVHLSRVAFQSPGPKSPVKSAMSMVKLATLFTVRIEHLLFLNPHTIILLFSVHFICCLTSRSSISSQRVIHAVYLFPNR